MTLDSFQNSDNKKYDGELCDRLGWLSSKNCDPYFIICVTDFRSPTSASNCPLMKITTDSWSNTGNVNFNSRRLTVNFSTWKVMRKILFGKCTQFVDPHEQFEKK